MNWNNHFGVYDREPAKAEISNCQIGMGDQYKQRDTFVWILSASQPYAEEKADVGV